ncbi:uncharacterized protein LOC117426430 isoform X3 [Acipenser ruthenus]|uniref:uncharacterized protein LOC117426430 isoform X3 n=1 Tax=Acipenser ruthenus TaxID=7906 RepID=UPI002742778A|nr:uncharacterized protein LOC117426430 isoform X3 [Acipenser ruthenus]
MNDKCMLAGEQSAPSAQETDRRQDEPLTKVENSSGLSIGYDQPVPGTSAVQNRQGYCSCCQVLYNSLEQHILSTRHRDFVSNSRNNVSANSLMERFLQDVIQHHPYRYNDSSLIECNQSWLLMVAQQSIDSVMAGDFELSNHQAEAKVRKSN